MYRPQSMEAAPIFTTSPNRICSGTQQEEDLIREFSIFQSGEMLIIQVYKRLELFSSDTTGLHLV